MIKKNMTLEEVKKLSPLCKCEKCSFACTIGSGCMTNEDVISLAKHLKINEEEIKKKYLDEIEKFNTKLWKPKLIKNGKPYGKCIFYEDGCSINEVKPTECRISMGCKDYGSELNQWFLLNYFVDENDPESIRQWNIYLKFNEPIEGGSLKEIVPDQDRRKKILSFEVLK